ncbi:MAG: hypothetical protein WB791_02165 [Waddliaceae bacterium]
MKEPIHIHSQELGFRRSHCPAIERSQEAPIHIEPLAIVQSRELSRCPNANF